MLPFSRKAANGAKNYLTMDKRGQFHVGADARRLMPILRFPEKENDDEDDWLAMGFQADSE
jgi:hypothetical protein